MPKPNTIIHKTFTYDCPDDYLSQERTLGKTGTWTYDGPDKIWVIVGKEDLQIHSYKDDEEDGEHYPTPIDSYKVLIDCNEDPLLATLCGADQVRDYSLLDQLEIQNPDGTIYTRPLVPPPDHTYELADIRYNPATGTFNKPYPWKKPHMSWQGVREWRNKWLQVTDDKESDLISDMPESLKAAWAEHRQKLRDLPQVFGATNVTTTIDLSATSPINTAGQKQIKVDSITGINVGDDVGVAGWPVDDIFDVHTTVVAINQSTKIITLDKNLVLTPNEANSTLNFSPCPEHAPWHIQPIMSPDEKG